MPRLAPTPLQLTEIERSQLQQVVNRHSTPQQIALRASNRGKQGSGFRVLKYALIDPSGSGQSTLLRLLLKESGKSYNCQFEKVEPLFLCHSCLKTKLP